MNYRSSLAKNFSSAPVIKRIIVYTTFPYQFLISQIMKLFIFFLFLPILLTKGQAQPTICLNQGACYLGSWAKTDKGTKYATFQGIRYAQPPIGDLR